MFNKLKNYMHKPELYEKSTNKFWDDEHISKGMLAAHLTEDDDSATRNHEFVNLSVEWISEQFPSKENTELLDLGCGPGIYGELFTNKGYKVLGIDFSNRSIDYAISHAKEVGLKIDYKYENYLEMKYENQFDLITLIWCDYGALATDDRALLLKNIYKALKPNGVLIFDMFTDKVFDNLVESKDYEYYPDGGFWNEEEHLCLNTSYLYDRTVVRQAIVVTNTETNCYNIWEHYFTRDEITKELENANFRIENLYGDIAGKEYSDESETMCLVVRK